MPPATKAEQRALLNAQLQTLDEQARAAASRHIVERLAAMPELRQARLLFGFSPLPSEPDIRPFLEAWLQNGKVLALPRLLENTPELEFRMVSAWSALRTSPRPGLRILEPDPAACPPALLDETDAVLVPGFGFSPNGLRLGRGGGHYDRLLARLPARVVRIGCFFACQESDAIDSLREPHDQPLDWIVTEAALHRFKRLGE